MSTLPEFIEARAADKEASADEWHNRVNCDLNALATFGDCACNGKAAVLREVAAIRRILALHGRMSIMPGHPMFNDAHLTTVPMVLCRSCEPETMWRRERSWPCRTIRAQGAIWNTHPEYEASWAPDPAEVP